MMKEKAFFLDRDGTLNVDYNFVHKPEEWTWCDGAIESLRWMKEQNFRIVIVTNQSGIVRGEYSYNDALELHEWVDAELRKLNLNIDLWMMAPHHPDFDPAPHEYPPEDRKPGTGMFQKAAEQLDIDFSSSFMAGDKISDMKPAIKLGITPLFIRSRHEPFADKKWLNKHEIPIYDTLWDSIRGEIADLG